MLRHGQQTGLVKDAVLAQHAIQVCLEPGSELFRAQSALQPALEEGAHRAVSWPEAPHAFAHGIHHARAVRDRDQRQAEFWIIEPLYHQQVTVVEGCGPDPHAHLAPAGLRHGPFGKGQVVKPELAGNLEGTHGCTRLQQGSGCLTRTKR